jgi:signal peptidase I
MADPSGANRVAPRTLRQRILTEIRGYAEALAIAYLVVTFVFNTVGVVGSSMRPNLDGGPPQASVIESLLTGDRVFIPKYETWLRRMGLMPGYARGDIVVVRDPTNSPTALETGRRPFFIKRVIAGPGDRVRIEAGQVIVNDHPIDQGFITGTGEVTPDRQDFPVITTEAGRLAGMVVRFMMTMSGNAVPDPAYADFGYPNAIPIGDPRVDLYYGPMLASLAPLPAGVADGVPFIHDLIVPEGEYFIMGDNRERALGGSEDSRMFGPVAGMAIAGRAAAIIWPPRRNGGWNWRTLPPPEAFDAVPAPR